MISGHTQIIAHLGVPTKSFTAPLIYNPWFEANGIDTIVVPMGCEAGDYRGFLPLLFRLRNIAGALVTMPHKMTTVDLLDEASTAVQVCGACNAVKRDPEGRLIGDMFDGVGVARGIKLAGREISGARGLLVGCGGVGSAIAASLAQAGAAHLGLHDLNPSAADALAGRLRGYFPKLQISTGTNDPVGWDFVINCTPLGMHEGDRLPFDAQRLDLQTFVVDVVLQHDDTALIREAKNRGCATMVGVEMLFEQIPAYLEFFGFPAASSEELRAVAGPLRSP